jgi:hypothetical protein
VSGREHDLPTTAAQVAVKETPNPELTRADRIAILEEIARDDNVPARERIPAIRVLDEMRSAEQPPGTFEDLDEVARRRARAKKAA